MRRAARLLLLLALAGTSLLALGWLRPYDPAPWLADLAALEAGAAAGFANLEWHAEHGVDPVALHRRADSTIRHAGSDRAARAALKTFTASFRDGHFAVVRPTPAWIAALEDRWTGRTEAPPLRSMSGTAACAAMGYEDDPGDASMLASLPGYRALDVEPFPAGVLTRDGRTIGVLRIATLGVDRFLPQCARAWEALRDSLAHPACDESCRSAIRLATGDALLADVRRALRALRDAGATALVVDLTGNGGGTEWVDPLARQFSARPLAAPRVAFPRHPHWARALEREAAAVDSILADPATAETLRPLLAASRGTLDSLLGEVRTPCDHSRLWTEGLDAARCRQLVAGPTYTSGALPHMDAATRAIPGSAALFWPALNTYEEGAWDGPLVLLVDGGSASASEQFVAMLHDAGAAVVVGERTLGAGCGMTDGGIPLTLPRSGLEVRMPDCARLRADGTNEVAGIAPDVAAGWTSGEDEPARAAKAARAIGTALVRVR